MGPVYFAYRYPLRNGETVLSAARVIVEFMIGAGEFLILNVV